MSVDHVAEGIARVIHQFKGKENFTKLLTMYLEEIQEIEDTLQAITLQQNISDAIGAQLDLIGDDVDRPRYGKLHDDDYRAALRLKIGINNSEATPDEILSVWKIFSQSNVVSLTEVYPAGVILYAQNPDTDASELTQVKAMLGAGVGLGIRVSTHAPFCFAGGVGDGFGTLDDAGRGGDFVSQLQ